VKQLAVHLALFAAVALALPFALGPYGVYLGCALCVWASFALAYDLAFGRAGLVSFGHAMFFGVGGYAFVLMILQGGFSFWPAFLGGIAAAAVFSAALGSIALRVTGHAFVIITVIFAATVELAAMSNRSVTRGEDGLTFQLTSIPLGPISVSLADPAARYAAFFAAFLLVYLVCWWIGRSSLGIVLSATRQNERRAALLGYPVRRYKLIAFTLSGTLSGVAGILFALLNTQITAEVFQITTSMNPLTAALVGGAGTALGPVLGAAVVLIMSDLLRSVVVFSDLIVGCVLIVTVLVAPKGLLGLWRTRSQPVPRATVRPESLEPSPLVPDRALEARP
jgi:branched-chain amino acid transport system permease protein